MQEPDSKIQMTEESTRRGMHFWALVLAILAVAGLIALLVYQLSRIRYAQQQYPFFSERTAFYAEIRPSLLSDRHLAEILAALGAQAAGADQQSARFLVQTLHSRAKYGLGFLVQDGHFFAFMPVTPEEAESLKEQEFILSDGQGLSNIHPVSIIEGENLYAVVGTKEFMPAGNYPIWLAEEKLELTRHQAYHEAVWFLKTAAQTGLKGVAAQEQGQLLLQGALGDALTEKTSIEVADIPFFFSQTATTDQTMIRFPQLSFFPPGSLAVYAGTWQMLQQKPFSPQSLWTWTGSESYQEAFQDELLDRLADLYPQSEPRELPDQTSVPELKRNETPFLSEPSQTGSHSLQTLLTYPDGQISVIDAGDELVSFIHGDGLVVDEPAKRQHACLLPGYLVYGSATGDFYEDDLWETLDFSWNQQEIALCLQLHT